MSARNTEMLINLIKPNTCLYDTSLEDYKNIQLKESIWLDIAKQMDKDVNTVRADWKKIRDCHRDAIKRRRLLRNEKDAKDIRKWKYEDQMSFLLSHMTNRKREPYFDNNDTTNIVPDNSSDDDCHIIQEPVINETFSLAFDGFIPQNQVADCSKSAPKQSTNSSREDPVDMFFGAMSATTKRLPTRYQMQIKREVFEIVTRYEEAAYEFDDSMH